LPTPLLRISNRSCSRRRRDRKSRCRSRRSARKGLVRERARRTKARGLVLSDADFGRERQSFAERVAHPSRDFSKDLIFYEVHEARLSFTRVVHGSATERACFPKAGRPGPNRSKEPVAKMAVLASAPTRAALIGSNTAHGHESGNHQRRGGLPQFKPPVYSEWAVEMTY
jgi:hypothetical protein